MKSYVKPQKGKVQQASPPFLTVMVRTARDPRPPAWRPSVHCGQDGVARGSPCCPLPGPTGSGVWNDFGEGGVSSLRSVQLQTQREPEERCSEHREPRSSPPRARWGACCVLPSALGRPACGSTPSLTPNASPSAYEAQPPHAAGIPSWTCRAPRICGCRPRAPSERSRRLPCLRPPAALLHWPSGCWLVRPAPLRAAAPVRALPQGVRQPLCPSCPRARQTRRRLDWEQSPAPSTEQEARSLSAVWGCRRRKC